MKCETPASLSSSSLDPPANMSTRLAERRSGIGEVTESVGHGLLRLGARLVEQVSFLERAEGCVESHRDEIRRHSVGRRIQRLAEELAHVGNIGRLRQLEAVADRLRDLGGRDLL